MKKSDVIAAMLTGKSRFPVVASASAFAPTNIALCKYWGKRNNELNLPVTSSLSISLADKGAHVTLSRADRDEVILNGVELTPDNKFSVRLWDFIHLFRDPGVFLKADITSNIPIAAGLASSACGFASIVMALNDLFAWNLSSRELSIFARLGSGSASRSLEHGFVEWRMGDKEDGGDSYAQRLSYEWPELCVGLLIFNSQEKVISSREAMRCTVETSKPYEAWPQQVATDLSSIKKALAEKNFELLGKTAEFNALAMHDTMLHATPSIQYSTQETLDNMQKIWELREAGLPLYFTQDAGPNLKLLFLNQNTEAVQARFPGVDIVKPFGQ